MLLLPNSILERLYNCIAAIVKNLIEDATVVSITRVNMTLIFCSVYRSSYSGCMTTFHTKLIGISNASKMSRCRLRPHDIIPCVLAADLWLIKEEKENK